MVEIVAGTAVHEETEYFVEQAMVVELVTCFQLRQAGGATNNVVIWSSVGYQIQKTREPIVLDQRGTNVGPTRLRDVQENRFLFVVDVNHVKEDRNKYLSEYRCNQLFC